MKLTPEIDQRIGSLADQYGVSRAAVLALLDAVIVGHGRMAQFHHPDLGGSGQWMAGGMTMVGDMFNHGLRARVAALCEELARLLPDLPADAMKDIQSDPLAPATSWWPKELGVPSQTGGQNDARYAIFPGLHRIAVREGGRCVVYDTLDYSVSGVSQQQGHSAGLTLSTNRGPISVGDLPVTDRENVGPEQTGEVRAASHARRQPPANGEPADIPSGSGSPAQAKAASAVGGAAANPDHAESIVRTIERLAELRDKGILSDAEFASKKAELLSAL